MPNGFPQHLVPLLTSTYVLYSGGEMMNSLLEYRLIKAERRLVFDILSQAEHTRWRGDDDGNFHTFKASNGYEVISRSRMDIQTERIWLLGASDETRSGTMVFSDNVKRDKAFTGFQLALSEWSQIWAPEFDSGFFYAPHIPESL